jgi:hypothetical protein
MVGCQVTSANGTRTWVARVRAVYPNQLDYSGVWCFHAVEHLTKAAVAALQRKRVSPLGTHGKEIVLPARKERASGVCWRDKPAHGGGSRSQWACSISPRTNWGLWAVQAVLAVPRVLPGDAKRGKGAKVSSMHI